MDCTALIHQLFSVNGNKAIARARLIDVVNLR